MAEKTSNEPEKCRMPAEWEPHAATWLVWPHNKDDWPDKLAAIEWVYGEIVRKLIPAETVQLIVASEAVKKRARFVLDKIGVDWQRISLYDFATNRGWTRDTGPIFVEQHGLQNQRSLAVCQFGFNAWARYDDFEHDARIAERAAAALNLPLIEAQHDGKKVVLEGGAIELNGAGALLTTEECLLDPEIQVRNPGLTRNDYEALFERYLGATQTIWLKDGIAGDDTHGHIDDLCRFVARDRVVLCQTDDPKNPSYRALAENRARLSDVRLEDGSALEVVALPMPTPLSFDGYPLPASYANFYIANETVLVPTFNDPRDRIALGILAELFPERTVLGIHAVDLVWGFGTLHCLTQQQPAIARAGQHLTKNFKSTITTTKPAT
jgi:agmatine deiminase